MSKIKMTMAGAALAATAALAAPTAQAADWNGGYGGAYLGASGGNLMLGVLAGLNYDPGDFVFGVEADVGTDTNFSGTSFFGRLRGGYELSDGVIGFVTYGIGSSGGATVYSAGLGAEFMVNGAWSVRLDLETQNGTANPFSGGGTTAVRAAAVYNF